MHLRSSSPSFFLSFSPDRSPSLLFSPYFHLRSSSLPRSSSPSHLIVHLPSSSLVLLRSSSFISSLVSPLLLASPFTFPPLLSWSSSSFHQRSSPLFFSSSPDSSPSLLLPASHLPEGAVVGGTGVTQQCTGGGRFGPSCACWLSYYLLPVRLPACLPPCLPLLIVCPPSLKSPWPLLFLGNYLLFFLIPKD